MQFVCSSAIVCYRVWALYHDNTAVRLGLVCFWLVTGCTGTILEVIGVRTDNGTLGP